MRDLSLSTGELGFLSSWDLWGNVLGFLPIGILLDRIPARYVGLTCLSIAIIATLGMAWTDQFIILCFLRFLQGIASSASLLITMRLGSSLFPLHANRSIGLMIFLALSGGIVGNSGFAFLTEQMSWQHALYWVASLGLGCLVMMIIFLHPVSSMQMEPVFLFPKLNRDSFRFSLFAGLNLGLLNMPVIILASLFGNHYLMQHVHFNMEQAAYFSSLLFTGIMFGSPMMGFCADKISAVGLLAAGYFGIFVCAFILIFIAQLPYFGYYVLFFVMGVCCCTQNLIYPLIRRKEPVFTSTAMAIAAIVSNSIGACSQQIFGYLI